MLRDGRATAAVTQAEAATRAGLSRGRWSDLETGRDAHATIATYSRAAAAVGGRLAAYITQTSAADQPRDTVHLGHQELIMREGRGGGWEGLAEEKLDADAQRSRWADVVLHRTAPDGQDEYALWDVRDWLEDVGATVRDFQRRLEALDQYAVAHMRGAEGTLPRTGGCLVLRATTRNRRLVSEHHHFFAGRFPGSGRAWPRALRDRHAPLPTKPALIWVAVRGDRLYPARLG
jgi:transcriptional regulator with XRE-family HTH domain